MLRLTVYVPTDHELDALAEDVLLAEAREARNYWAREPGLHTPTWTARKGALDAACQRRGVTP